MKKRILYFTLSIAILACSKDEKPPNNNDISISTLRHIIHNDGGVTLVGSIRNVEIPLDYGFVISTEEGGTFNGYGNKKVLTGIHNGEFSIDFKSDLRIGQTYYYNTIAFKNGGYIYGEEKSFLSNGSAKPEIKSVIPNKAHLGDTIVINGVNFSKSPEVYFNTWTSKTLISNDTLVKCIVTNRPDYNKDILPFLELKLRSNTQDETIYNEFSLHTPRIDSIRPFEVYPGDTLTVYGDHFHRETHGNRLIISGNYGTSAYPEVIKANEKELKFILREISSYEPVITIESQSQTVVAKNRFRAIMPTITGLSKNPIYYGNKLVVYGKHFPNRLSYNNDTLQYSLGKELMNDFETYKDSLVINITPHVPYDDFTIKGINIRFFNNDIKYNEDIVLNENYVRVSYFTGDNIAYGAVGNDLYAVAYSHNFLNKYLVKLNKNTFEFDQLYPNDPYNKAPKGLYFSFHGTKFYSFDTPHESSPFFSYDIFTNVKKQLESFPGESRLNPIHIFAGDYLYYGLGSDLGNSNGLSDIWRYSVTNDEWEFVSNLPEINSYDKAKVNPLTFVINSKIYIGGGQPEFKTQLVDFWELDTNTKIITKKRDLPHVITNSIMAITIGGKAYHDYGGNQHSYDPASDIWTSKPYIFNYDGFNKYIYSADDYVYASNTGLFKIKKTHF